MERLYQERLRRYTAAMRNEKPDCIPIRPFVAEFTARYGGYTAQEITHDFRLAFEAARKCAAAFDWDAVVSNMVYVWTGLTEAIGLSYYGVPGVDLPAETGFQYREPAEDRAFMKADEYDALIEDPTGFLYTTWLPRVSRDLCGPGESTTYRNNLALVKGGMAMMQYFMSFAEQNRRLREESGTVSALAGIFKAPFDILGDKLRGYMGLTMDMHEQPDKVLAACEALMPHLLHVALCTADPEKQVPVGFWMHRGCVPFVRPNQFDSHYWPTLKPLIQALWAKGHQTLFYAEGDWNFHLDRFAELPEGSIIYHADQSDIFEAHKIIGDRFCLSGGIPNFLLSYRSPDEVRACCKKVIDGVARDGGYIMDAGAIMQDDTLVENLQALTEFTREYGVYSAASSQASADSPPGREARESAPSRTVPEVAVPEGAVTDGAGQEETPQRRETTGPGAGVCIPWEEKIKEMTRIQGDGELVQRIWEEIDGLGNAFVWHCLVSF